ncbi:putative phosphatidylserine decarboxylase [Rosellinia necatrix]|uniref:Putative phosphatidylserine decarboxylase n=1 Tax=Rosellinia necatrix TaxID=77044 RepID=A0A1W2TJC8_ROSNE|nr:putative phosphatidylserine decarboxylase [Rosellinia necatrix]
MARYQALVQDFKDFVRRAPDRQNDFDNAMQSALDPRNGGSEEMALENISNMEDYYRFCDDLLCWVPDVDGEGDALLRKLLVFYWLFNQPTVAQYQTAINPASINDDPKWLSYWQVTFARGIGSFLETRSSASRIQSFYDSPLYNQEAYLWQDEPSNGWACFNQFFSRRWKDINVARPLSDADKAENVVVSSADSRFNGHWDVVGGEVAIKGFNWPISKLLQYDDFNGVSFMHAFLGPSDYHRQHAPVSGKVIHARVIQEQVYLQVTKSPDQIGLTPDRGFLLGASKKRAAPYGGDLRDLDAPDEAGYQWCQTRGLIIIQTDNYGKVAVLPIGMALVSSVVLTVSEDQWVNKGDEISYFQFGGSDIVLVFERPVDYVVNVKDKCNVRTQLGTLQ